MNKFGLMIDIETLATSHDAAILEIAAVPFWYDMRSGVIRQPKHLDQVFQEFPRIEGDQDKYAFVDPNTIAWWQDETRAEAYKRQLDAKRISASIAIAALYKYITDLQKTATRLTIWSLGRFDIPILEFHFRHWGYTVPWHYRDVNDLRTVFEICGTDPRSDIRQVGMEYHTAMGDCLTQIKAMDIAIKTYVEAILYEHNT